MILEGAVALAKEAAKIAVKEAAKKGKEMILESAAIVGKEAGKGMAEKTLETTKEVMKKEVESLPKQIGELPEVEHLPDEIGGGIEADGLPDEIGDEMPLESQENLNEVQDNGNMETIKETLQIDEKHDLGVYPEREEGSGRIEEMPYEEKVARQEKELSDVESGVKSFDRENTHEVGNYGEMKTDQDLREKGYERISNGMVTGIDENGHQGLDGVYYNPDGKPQYLVVDAKYGSASLNPNTKDGKQMSENWIDQRLDKDLGKEKADEIRMEKILDPDNVGAYVAHVREDGTVTYDRLDNAANVIEKDVKL